MPQPFAYRHCQKEWDAILADARERMDLVSDNQAYTVIDAVFRVFRRRLTAAQGLAFADVLPAVPRAMFLYGWRAEPPVPWRPRAELAAEAQAVRPHHNATPPDAIDHVARTLRRHVRQIDLDRELAAIGPEAEAFWHVEVDDPRELAQRIV